MRPSLAGSTFQMCLLPFCLQKIFCTQKNFCLKIFMVCCLKIFRVYLEQQTHSKARIQGRKTSLIAKEPHSKILQNFTFFNEIDYCLNEFNRYVVPSILLIKFVKQKSWTLQFFQFSWNNFFKFFCHSDFTSNQFLILLKFKNCRSCNFGVSKKSLSMHFCNFFYSRLKFTKN